MGRALDVLRKVSFVRRASKVVAVAASTAAAMITVFSALYRFGMVGTAESHETIGNLGATWVGLRPVVDTAAAIGDTTHFAATITDRNGSILVGARPVWTTGDSSVATVLPNGSVIANGPGTTTVAVVVGGLVAHSSIVVRQRVAVVEIAGPSGDSVIVVPEDARLPIGVRALDARGHGIAGLPVTWQVDDSSVAALEEQGVLVGRNAGRTVVSAVMAGVSGRAGVSVVTTAAGLALVAGAGQHAPAGGTLPRAVVVRATNRRGAPTAGQFVQFRVADGQGTVTPSTTLTDADGRARATWTLAAYPGRQTLLATVEKVDSALSILAEADPVARNTRVTVLGELLGGRAGAKLADPIAVRVTDSAGRALGDVPVRWTADGGTVEAVADRTDSLGVARAYWTLGRKSGTQRLRAHAGGGQVSHGIPPVTIGARAAAGPPVSLVIVSGDAQRVAAGATLRRPVKVRLIDSSGNGVAGTALTLSPSSGSVADSVLDTDSLGFATVRWTMGRSAGKHTLVVHARGVGKATRLTATALPGAPANLSFDDVPASARRSGSPAATRRLYAFVTDVYGNPVPDAQLRFAAKSGVVTPARAVSDARGRVALTWKLGAKPGEQLLTGLVHSTSVRGAYATQRPGNEPPRKVASAKPGKR